VTSRRRSQRLREGRGSEAGFVAPSAARLNPPRARGDAAIRSRLTTRLVAERPRLVLLVAPPGFGKTTLLTQWAAQDPRPFAWLLADEQDDDPTALWTDIAAAVAASMNEVLSEQQARAIAGDPDPGQTLGGKLEAAGTEIVVVIDEYAHIHSPRCHEALFRFVERGPPNVEMAIASRREPPFPLARLRASGEVLDLRVSDLRFTLEESERFLNETLQLDLEPRYVRVLHDRTEGWPAGMYLAHFGLRSAATNGAPDAPAAARPARAVDTRFLRGFGASNRYVADYLNQEVLAGQDEATLDFMLKTSVVALVSASLADALTERHDSATRLVELEQANVFIEPLDDNREWYRYHALLRELLLAELSRRSPDEVPALHVRASEWHERTGDVERAVSHALSAGDADRAARLIGENYLSRIEWGRAATVDGWLQRIGDDVIQADARLGIARAWTLHFLGRHAEAAEALAAAQGARPEGVVPDGSSNVELATMLMDAAFSGEDVSRMLNGATAAFARESGDRSRWQATVHVLLGLALVRSGRFAEADPYLVKGEDLARRSRLPMDEIGARSLRARVALELGRPDRALTQARAAMALARRRAMETSHSGALALAVLGATLVSVGRPAEAEATLRTHEEEVRRLQEQFVPADFLLALAQAHHALGRTAVAAQFFDEVEEIVESMPDPGDLRRRVREARRRTLRKGARAGEALTERELEVLRLLTAGLTAREAANQLFVTFNTVHSHVRTIYRKLGVGSRPEAIARGRELGVAPTEERVKRHSPG
jgi:LuxR family transcriptional regulator, maltose regulon positive regulatory protein